MSKFKVLKGWIIDGDKILWVHIEEPRAMFCIYIHMEINVYI